MGSPDFGARHLHADATPHTRTERVALVLVVVIPLVATVYAISLLWNRLVGWTDLGILLLLYVLTAMGIGVGYHRMLTHRSFEAPEWLRGVFLALGSAAVQGPAVEWAATHYKHHAKSDKEGDPHSPLEGFWAAHLGWLFRDRMIKNGVWAKPFEKDRTAHFIDRTFLLWVSLGFLVPALLGAWLIGGWEGFWRGMLWGGAVRLFLVHHVTWSVNSICHTFGKREFHSNDESRNHWVIGLLGLGEGWHNNHHAFPKAAYHGMKWYQFDFNALVIRLFKALGLVRNVWMPSKEALEARRVRRENDLPTDGPLPGAPTASRDSRA